MAGVGRRNTRATVAARRAQIYQWYTLGRWNSRDRAVLMARWNIRESQLYADLKRARRDVTEHMKLTDTEAIRSDLVQQLRNIQRLAALHLMCRTCKGGGLVEVEAALALGMAVPADAEGHLDCAHCQGTGANPDTRPQWARVIMDAVEHIRKLAGIETPPEAVVQVQVMHASPLALLQQVRAGVQAVEAAGILTVPVAD